MHYRVYACGEDHSCPASRRCVLDPTFNFDFVPGGSNCSCERHQPELLHYEPGRIRQFAGCELCLHKAMWPPNWHDVHGTLLLLLAGMLSGAVGIGGGGLAVPIFVIAMGFHVKEVRRRCHAALVHSCAHTSMGLAACGAASIP